MHEPIGVEMTYFLGSRPHEIERISVSEFGKPMTPVVPVHVLIINTTAQSLACGCQSKSPTQEPCTAASPNNRFERCLSCRVCGPYDELKRWNSLTQDYMGNVLPSHSIVAGILIWRGGETSKRSEEVEERLREAPEKERNILEGDDRIGLRIRCKTLQTETRRHGRPRSFKWCQSRIF